jgi:hypothetical protein
MSAIAHLSALLWQCAIKACAVANALRMTYESRSVTSSLIAYTVVIHFDIWSGW